MRKPSQPDALLVLFMGCLVGGDPAWLSPHRRTESNTLKDVVTKVR